jgi:uncharacterized protein (DUF983 family)
MSDHWTTVRAHARSVAIGGTVGFVVSAWGTTVGMPLWQSLVLTVAVTTILCLVYYAWLWVKEELLA